MYNRDKQLTIKAVMLVAIESYVDQMHAKGAPVTNKKVRGMLTDKYQLHVTRRSVQRAMKKLGLCWRPSKPKARMLGAY
jgi:transposase